MPSYSQEIELTEASEFRRHNGPSRKGNNEKIKFSSDDPTKTVPDGLNQDQKQAFELRDFLKNTNKPMLEEGEKPDLPVSILAEKLPYIDDEQVESEEAVQSDEEQLACREADEVLNNAACRLRRWRAASQKLRRPRIIDNLSGMEQGGNAMKNALGVHTDLADRLRSLAAAGSVSVSAGELLSLAPPTAATAPPSPGCLLSPTLANQTSAEYFRRADVAEFVPPARPHDPNFKYDVIEQEEAQKCRSRSNPTPLHLFLIGSSPECCADTSNFEISSAGVPVPPPGPRYKLASEGSLRVCTFQHTRTVVDKILAAKFLRRWESHVLRLLEEHLVSKTPSGLLERPLSYSCMQEVYCISRWDPARKYCLRIVVPHGSLLLQANDAYTRDQWYYSIIWKRNMIRYRNFLTKTVRKEVVLKELKNMVDFAMTTPLQDESVTRAPLQILTALLSENKDEPDWEEWAENVTSTAAPLLAERGVTGELCALLARLCRHRPRAAPLPALAPPVRRVLTRNVDFGKAPDARRFVRDYISALSAHNSGASLVRRFVAVTHGSRAACPHPRAAPNLVAVALAALDDYYRGQDTPHRCQHDEHDVLCFADILEQMCEYEDWVVVVGSVLQPVPLCAGALGCARVSARLAAVLRALARDPRCAAHASVAPACAARPSPPSWLRAAAPSDPALALPAQDLCRLWGAMIEGLLNCCCKRKNFLQSMSKQLPDFLLVALTEHPAALEALCLMLEWEVACGEQTQLEIIAALQATDLGHKYYKELCERQRNLQKLIEGLLNCCCKRKNFLQSMSKQLPDFLLVALTEHPAALEALCLMLEWEVACGEQTQLEIIAALQATDLGHKYYKELCERQRNLQKLQSVGGPRQMALPVRATDADLSALLGSGALGNLECLSLAFTCVTSACAHDLIKIADLSALLGSGALGNLECLSLAFTCVTSACAHDLIKLPSLRYLNLWATKFGDSGVQLIAEHLPRLQLPSLRYLNLWATKFGDSGVQLIAEHLPRLQVLNLCETPVSDKGIEALIGLPSLRRLNLNSTKLSAEAFETVRRRLPHLQEYDVRYTEAW
ncbi:C-Maf-inducing protein [Papilio machaon]|uniref:C-Maf-inducing protein n=1 Tax=Papilio machaon TaxID=76193 RepID=A0A194QVM0_PAPMA|nr:C-Maf-inducing protein [Papilio machaon]